MSKGAPVSLSCVREDVLRSCPAHPARPNGSFCAWGRVCSKTLQRRLLQAERDHGEARNGFYAAWRCSVRSSERPRRVRGDLRRSSRRPRIATVSFGGALGRRPLGPRGSPVGFRVASGVKKAPPREFRIVLPNKILEITMRKRRAR